MSSLITVRYSSKHILTCSCTTDLHKLVNAAVTTKILSIVVTLMSVGFLIKLIGRVQQELYISSLVDLSLFLHEF